MTGFLEPLSVNALAKPLTDKLVADAGSLRLSVSAGPGDCRFIDAGAEATGSVEAGRRIAEICLAGLGEVSLAPSGPVASWPFSVTVRTANPVLACLGCQYAGWSLNTGTGKGAYFALGSGPGRAAARVEPLFMELGYHDNADSAVLVLETASPPPEAVIQKVAEATGLPVKALTFIYAPTQSLAGTTQVVSRVLEVALHKAHTLGFPLAHIVDGMGTAPLAPPTPNFVRAMGRTNDAIIYGGRVQLFVSGSAAAAAALAEALPSAASRDHGKPFAEIFSAFNGDFYAIDPHLFSPAEVMVTALENGQTYRGGQIMPELVNASFS
ncbi:Methenyltetrahydromethanopterin cyclohydrolase [Labrys miyagiensis]